MKFTNTRYIFLLAILSVFIYSCNQNSKSSDSKKILSVSIEPQRYFLGKLVENNFTINTVIPLGSNPESYDPSPSQMVSIGKSLVYFKIGRLGFENTWLKNIELNNQSMIVVDCSTGIAPIEHSHDGHTHGDPHIWSSPKTALAIIKNMYNCLVSIDKDKQSFYLDNYKKLEESINKTDSIIKSYIDIAPSKSFIIYHPALSYFSDEYDLHQLSIEVDGKSPSPKQLSSLIKEAKLENVKVIFIQEEFDIKNAEIIANEIGAKIITINPLSYDWHNEMIKVAKGIAQVE